MYTYIQVYIFTYIHTRQTTFPPRPMLGGQPGGGVGRLGGAGGVGLSAFEPALHTCNVTLFARTKAWGAAESPALRPCLPCALPAGIALAKETQTIETKANTSWDPRPHSYPHMRGFGMFVFFPQALHGGFSDFPCVGWGIKG